MAVKPKQEKKERGFEEGLARLEALAAQMELNELPLEKLLALYEEGIKLSAELGQKLEAAQGRMLEIKRGKDGKPEIAKSSLSAQLSLLGGEEKEE